MQLKYSLNYYNSYRFEKRKHHDLWQSTWVLVQLIPAQLVGVQVVAIVVENE